MGMPANQFYASLYQSWHVAWTTAKLARTRAARMVDAIGFEPIRVVYIVNGGSRCTLYLPGTRVSIFVQSILRLRQFFLPGLTAIPVT